MLRLNKTIGQNPAVLDDLLLVNALLVKAIDDLSHLNYQAYYQSI